MADTMRVRTSVQAAVASGQKLASLLQMIIELRRNSEFKDLRQFYYDVQAPFSILLELKGLIGLNEATGLEQNANLAVTSEYLAEMETLAVKCGSLYKSIILIIQKAGIRANEKEGNTQENSLENLKTELLTGPIPDPGLIKTLKLLRTLSKSDQREWLGTRTERCHDQLKWINTGLLIHLHIFKLAHLQTRSFGRNAGDFENELIHRSSIQLFRKRQVAFTKRKAKHQETAQRQWELQKREDNSETVSVTSVTSSVTSSVTNSTAVGDEPSVNGDSTAGKGAAEDVDSDQNGSMAASKNDQASTAGGDQDENKQSVGSKTTALNASGGKGKTLRSLALSGLSVSELPSYLYDWKQRIFGVDDKFKTDWASTSLEAYVRPNYHYGPYGQPGTKVPFGHKRLHYGLNKITKEGEKGKSTWNRYLELDLGTRNLIALVVAEANRHQSRERVCVAFQEYNKGSSDSFILVFLSLRKEPPSVSFKDAIGRTYNLPFETCKKWETMRETIVKAFTHVKVIGDHVSEGHFDLQPLSENQQASFDAGDALGYAAWLWTQLQDYDIDVAITQVTSNGDVILPHLWNTTIKPGTSISMRMWPESHVPLRGPHGVPPFITNPHGQNGESHLHAAHLARFRQLQQERLAPMRPPPMMAPPPPPGGFPTPHGMPGSRSFHSPPRVEIVDATRSETDISENQNISEEEDAQLTFVDFIEELEKSKTATVADLLKKFTNLKDITDEDGFCDILASNSDYDSDDSATSSSSSEIIND